MPLEIQILKDVGPRNTGAVTVKLTGSLDTATAPELERQLASTTHERRRAMLSTAIAELDRKMTDAKAAHGS